jgi:hypothetical protein
MPRRANTKYLLGCSLRHLHYSSINRDSTNDKLGLSNDVILYEKSSNTKISEFDMLEEEEGDKVVNSHALLRQRLGL